MDTYTSSTYGERHADIYDSWHGSYDEASIITLTELARGGPALELGIGTGRIAIPLAMNGVDVQGIDASPAMVAKLKAKAGGNAIPVTIGDFADVGVEGRFSLVYVVINTFFSLLSQQEQVRCFRNVARHLTDEGVFLLEVFVPDMSLFVGGREARAVKITTESVSLQVSLHDAVEQRVIGQQVVITERGIRLYPVQIRYAWPSELDLMAHLVGLRLRNRWSGWKHAEFASSSQKHISVYERMP